MSNPADTSVQNVLSFDGHDDYVQFPGVAIPRGKQVTISFWSYGGGAVPRQTTAFSAYDTKNVMHVNVHLPWSDGHVYFELAIYLTHVAPTCCDPNRYPGLVGADRAPPHTAAVRVAPSGDTETPLTIGAAPDGLARRLLSRPGARTRPTATRRRERVRYILGHLSEVNSQLL